MYIGACRPPGMNAGRIEAARLKRKGSRTQQGIFWQIDDGFVCRSMEVMGMEIHFHKSFQPLVKAQGHIRSLPKDGSEECAAQRATAP